MTSSLCVWTKCQSTFLPSWIGQFVALYKQISPQKPLSSNKAIFTSSPCFSPQVCQPSLLLAAEAARHLEDSVFGVCAESSWSYPWNLHAVENLRLCSDDEPQVSTDCYLTVVSFHLYGWILVTHLLLVCLERFDIPVLKSCFLHSSVPSGMKRGRECVWTSSIRSSLCWLRLSFRSCLEPWWRLSLIPLLCAERGCTRSSCGSRTTTGDVSFFCSFSCQTDRYVTSKP